jgi:hypothetical protein
MQNETSPLSPPLHNYGERDIGGEVGGKYGLGNGK